MWGSRRVVAGGRLAAAARAAVAVAVLLSLLPASADARRPRVFRPALAFAPTVSTTAATSLTPRSATLTGTVNPNRLATTYWFQYGTSIAYGTSSPAITIPGGHASVAVSAAVSGLPAASALHFRLVARSAGGSRAGNDVSFTTPGYYTNPVYGAAAGADPFVLDNGGGHNDYYAFTTGDLFPVLHSTDLVNWSSVGTAMSARPSWVVQSGEWHPWAPNVLHVPEPCPGTASSACYVMYYTGISAQTQANCVAVATATSPRGPYTDQGPLSDGTTDSLGRPLGCGDSAGYGMIDPSPFIDPATGQAYLYASEDFACLQPVDACTGQSATLQPTISVIPLSTDLLHAAGPRVPLFGGDPGTWEATGVVAPTVEGPSLQLHNGTYYLLYSGGSWQTGYGMGYATAASPTGPFTKGSTNPILSATATTLTPGGGDTPVTGPHGGQWMVYHARTASLANPRTLRIDPFSWRASPVPGAPDIPVIAGPSSTPQPNQP